MKPYKYFCKNFHNAKEGREEIEWVNFWYSKANKKCEKKVLLIGDSTSRMIRSQLERELSIPVDLFGTSCGLHDVMFADQIDAFFANNTGIYTCIIVQIGNHSRINEEGRGYTQADYKTFQNDYLALISYLRQFGSSIVVETIFECVQEKNIFQRILCFLRLLKEKPDEIINSNTIQKNDIIKKIAKAEGLALCDVNQFAKDHKFIREDHIHFLKIYIKPLVNYVKTYVI